MDDLLPDYEREVSGATDILSLYLNDLHDDVLTAEEELLLSQQVAQGCAASRDKMIRSNLPLVINRANFVKSRIYSAKGFDMMDAIMEGNIGLIRAVEKFDPGLGNRFSTYATHWIDQEIDRAIKDKQETIRIPVHVHRHLAVLYRIERELNADLESVELGFLSDKMNEATSHLKTSEYTDKDVLKLKRLKQRLRGLISLDLLVGDEEGSGSLVDILPSPLQKNPVEGSVVHVAQQKLITDAIRCIDPKERQVIILRFGLFNVEQKTVTEIAGMMDLSIARIGQIYNSAVKKIYRHFSRAGVAWGDVEDMHSCSQECNTSL